MQIRLVAALAAACFAVPGACAQPAPVPDGTGAIALPFAPPIGEPRRYRLVREAVRDGRTSRSINDIDVTFLRGAGETVARVDYVLPPTLAPSSPDAMLMRPVTFRLDGRGSVAGIVDPAGYWAAIDDALDRLDRAPSATAGDAAFAAQIRRMRTMPEPERSRLLAAKVGRLLDYGGVTVPTDEPVRIVLQGVVYERRTRAETLGDGNVRIVVETAPRGAAPAGEAEPRGAMTEGIVMLRFEERETYIVSARTGVTESWESRRVSDEALGGAVRHSETVQTLSRSR